jgi:hypothetical protein
MKTQIKIIRFWIGENYNQLFIILFLVFFLAQMARYVIG